MTEFSYLNDSDQDIVEWCLKSNFIFIFSVRIRASNPHVNERKHVLVIQSALSQCRERVMLFARSPRVVDSVDSMTANPGHVGKWLVVGK